jgi:nucleoside-diphosphate-sugar epimerase
LVGAVVGVVLWLTLLHWCCRLWGGGKTQLLPVPVVRSDATPLPRVKSPGRPGSSGGGDDGLDRTVVVTGGSGLVGACILRHLLGPSAAPAAPPSCVRPRRFRYRVVSVDRCSPPAGSPRFVAGVEYVQGDLVSLGAGGLGALLRSHAAHAVVHTAGVVQLRDDAGLLLNVNHGVTVALLQACQFEAPTVRALVLTSSASVVNNGRGPSRLLRADDHPAPDPAASPRAFSTHYARSKALAEAATLGASAVGRRGGCSGGGGGGGGKPCPGFHTCALRLPGVYGLGDPWMFGPLSKGKLAALPGDPRARVEMVYAENAAHAHACAVDRLLGEAAGDDADDAAEAHLADKVGATPAARKAEAEDSCRGRSFHVTNGEPDWPMGAFVACAVECFKVQQPSGPPTPLPAAVSFVVVRLVEFGWWLLHGCVPCKSHPAWDFTRAALGYMSFDGTLDTAGSEERLGYTPLFGVKTSVEHIHARWAAENGGEAARQATRE